VVAIVLVLLVCALAALAILQYRWIERFSAAERVRRRADAEFAASRIAGDLRDELHASFQVFRATEDDAVASLYERWLRRAPWPGLISAVYVAERTAPKTWMLYRLEQRTGEFVEAPWPPELASLRPRIDNLGARGPRPNWPPPVHARTPAIVAVQRPGELAPPFDDGIPFRVVIAQVSREALGRTVMPALLERISAGDEPRFDVTLAAGHDVLYRSNSAWAIGDRSADAAAPVPADPMRPMGDRTTPGRPLRGGRASRKAPPQGEGPREPPVEMQVLVRYRAGGLESLVEATRRRNLATSAGILAILLAAVAMLVVLLRRAERLRAQEAAFVSVMSHELNTPVAVLRSAGENLKDGIVGGDQIAVYGQTIVDEADRLKHMIGEVLELAGMQARTEPRPHRIVAIAPIVEAAVERCRLLVNGAIEIESMIEPGLPPVSADDDALVRAVQNLIVNAIRHGGAGGWVGVRARRDGKRVTITVEDRGPGVHAADFDQVFEPFYRGRDSGSVSGAGLGLTIVRQIAADHGGDVTLDRREAGASFTLHLPAEVGRA
jgi:signal transduction histidine kinase